MQKIRIKTSFGQLRPWQMDDAEALINYANNRNISKNLRDVFPYPYTKKSAQEFLSIACNQEQSTLFAIATEKEAIGGIGITINTDVHRLTAEMGYWLAEPYWGKGIMTETVQKFTDYCFSHFDLIRIYAEPYETNIGSCKVLEKAGFVLEGRLRKNVIKGGKVLDQFMYAKIKETLTYE